MTKGKQKGDAAHCIHLLEADSSHVTWTYDPTYQLSNEHRTGSNPYSNTFTYDPAGNRTMKNETGQRTTYAYDAANQLTTSQDSIGTTTYTFDADGNQQIVQPPTGARTTTVWDYENRTTLVDLPSGLRNTMAYDPDGLRAKLEDSTGTKKFVWDDQNYLAEADENNDTQVVYNNEPASYGSLVSQHRSSTTNWFHFDALGSTRELTLATEAVSDTYFYDSWGNLLTSTGNTINPFQFIGEAGYYLDTGIGTYYLRERIYESLLTRFLSRDPLDFEAGDNSLYRYVGNNPMNWTDPSGMKIKGIWGGGPVAAGCCILCVGTFVFIAGDCYDLCNGKANFGACYKRCWRTQLNTIAGDWKTVFALSLSCGPGCGSLVADAICEAYPKECVEIGKMISNLLPWVGR